LAVASLSALAHDDTKLLRERTPAQRPTLLVLGTGHLNNPGRDVVNIKVDDILADARQAQILAIVEQLTAFRPTHVAVEWSLSEQGDLDKRYREYRGGDYPLSRNEVDQLGLRLAAKLPRATRAAQLVPSDPPTTRPFVDVLGQRQRSEGAKRKGERTRDRLKIGAIQALEQRGYLRMRVSDICKRAKVSPAVFYLYFKNKREITVEVLTEFLESLFAPSRASESPRSLFDAIYQTNLTWVYSVRTNAGLMRCLLQLSDNEDEFKELNERQNYEWFVRVTHSLMRRFPQAKLDERSLLLAVYALGGMTSTLLRSVSCLAPSGGGPCHVSDAYSLSTAPRDRQMFDRRTAVRMSKRATTLARSVARGFSASALRVLGNETCHKAQRCSPCLCTTAVRCSHACSPFKQLPVPHPSQ
jgi:AcrR family transcriptional regulator